MGRSLFVDLVDSGGRRGKRRGWTVVPVSVTIHAVVVGVLLVVARTTASQPPEPVPPPIHKVDLGAIVTTPTPVPQAPPPIRIQRPPKANSAGPAPVAAPPPPVIGVPPVEPDGLPPTDPGPPPANAEYCVGCASSPEVGSGTPGQTGIGDTPIPVWPGGQIEPPVKVRSVDPEYPRLALNAGIGGAVVLDCTIDKTGAVADVRVVSGNELFVPAAVDAVKKWRYSPTKLNGRPVSVVMTVLIRFTPKR